MSVIGFDISVETTLKAVVGSLDASSTPNDRFQGLVQQVENLLANAGSNQLPDKANIQHIHAIRNDAQHKARYPNEIEVSDCRTYARDFLQKILQDTWGLQFERISLIDLIQNDEARKYLADAESALEKGDYRRAVEEAAAGLTRALAKVKASLVGKDQLFIDGIIVQKSIREPGPDESILEAFRKMQDTLMYLSLGMNIADHMHFYEIAGMTIFTINGKHEQFGVKEPLQQKDAEFVVAYCTDSVVQIEEQVGSLDKPFGKDFYYWH